MTTPLFVHLHCHTEYSLIDSVVKIPALVKQVQASQMPACAMTDVNNLFGLVKFYTKAQAAGIKPIIGADITLRHDNGDTSQLVLLCQNLTGYRNLTRLVSREYVEGQQQGNPHLDMDWLIGQCEGLIALSGAQHGNIGQALLNNNRPLAKQRLEQWLQLFPNRFYLELQRTGREGEDIYLPAAVELATECQVPVVATNDVVFLDSEDFEAHEVRVSIHDGYTLDDARRPHRYSEQQYLRTPAEMAELFSDIPEAIANSWKIAQRCTVEIELGKYYLPNFSIPAGQTIEDYFREQARIGLEARLAKLYDNTRPDFTEIRAPYDARLQRELDVILHMGFPGYFLIVADFIQWAKDNDIPVGPGRGSGAGSLVAYALKITDLNPMDYELLFERFLNPERVSMPDFDIDFCMERRDEVIEYVAGKYGRNSVSQIITYGTMAAKAVVRDVGRVLGHPYTFVDAIAKLIPFEPNMKLDKALNDEAELRRRYSEEEDVQLLIDMAKKLEGLARNVGKHAGGVVIAPSALTDFTPLYCEEGTQDLVSQFDKNDVESVGLVKFDFLGLRTLTIIDWALATINQWRDAPLDILSLPLNDAATYELYQKGTTTAVFQVESRGMKELLKRLKPTCFEDVIAVLALYRPGPLDAGMVDDFVARKNDPTVKFDYLHADLNDNAELVNILKPTYGVIAYQEQVMQIAQVLAGYTLGGADLLRRAMGKKKPEEMAKQRSVFVEGALNNNISAETAGFVFDLVEKFAGYGFNKSHSAAYALVSYQTAWLKAHHPAAFMAAVLSSDMDKTDKVVGFIDECRNMQLKVLKPDINHSEFKFTVDPEDHEGSIRYGLGAIKGAGEGALIGILAERNKGGGFKDLFDFCQRVDLRKVNRRVMETLIHAGALDGMGSHRASLLASLDVAIKRAEQQAELINTGQNDMFGLGGDNSAVADAKPLFVEVAEWTDNERLTAEKDSLGLYLSGHPIKQYLPELRKFINHSLAEVRPTERHQTTKVTGLVLNVRIVNGRGGKMGLVMLDDGTARLEVKIFSDLLDTKQTVLAKDTVLVMEGEVRTDNFNSDDDSACVMTANNVLTLAEAREIYAKRVVMRVAAEQADMGLAETLTHLLTPYKNGGCPVVIQYQRADAQVDVVLGEQWRIAPDEGLLGELRQLLGQDGVIVKY